MPQFRVDFWICFVTLFVAVDVVGIIPIYAALTADIDPARKRRIVVQSIITAFVVAVAFMAVGKQVLSMLGVQPADFMVAGGILLLIFSISDISAAEKRQRHVDPESVGAVPLGVPLVVGPAVLTALLILPPQHGGYAPTVLAFIANLLVTMAALFFTDNIMRLFGRTGSRVVSKVVSLLMAAIGVMFLRKGIEEIVGTFLK
ncbi:MAG: MarC family protein [Planctomycetota bacterium]